MRPSLRHRSGNLPAHERTLHRGALVCVLALAIGCGEATEPEPIVVPDTPWSLSDYQPQVNDGIRVLIVHDMEGLSGQDDPSSFDYGTDLYPTGQELLAADINAVVDGLFAGGATEVVIADGHGSGNPEPDLRGDLLDARATQIIRDKAFDTYFDLPDSEAIDAVAVVGMHAKTGSGGFASHTFTLGIDLLINGQSITETELVALSWGRVGVPVIFASGDDRLARDLETMPWLERVTVKMATAADRADLRPVGEARADLRDGAKRAVERLASAKVMRVNTPIRASLRAVPPASLRFLDGIPGIDYRDDTLTFVTGDLREAYDGLVEIVGLARVGYVDVLQEVVRNHPDGDAIFAEYSEALSRRWFDQESGRYQRPAADSGETSSLQRFHGYR
ncbi:MAG TPA: M55 family metallopeptidase [Vicinamibacteria bacterium]|nr:M55 family metallopeptidase [Vicinamibacteria bacterium]